MRKTALMQLTEMLAWRSQAGAKLEASPSMASEYNSGRYSVLPREREMIIIKIINYEI